MGLKQSIVIKSEYTNNARSKPGGGSRGASPGQYVLRYMAREDATEVLAPVRHDADIFLRYMARSEATESLKLKETGDATAFGAATQLKATFASLDKQSGRAFGTDGLSLSHDDLVAAGDVIQTAFDAGHSVQKVVLSFTEDYLKETGVVDETFTHRGRGSFKGHVDQLKLRSAITEGVESMTKVGKFADPYFVGTVQFDTSNVHAHLAIVDREFAESRMKPDGADRGKINEAEKLSLRKGIHRTLVDLKQMHAFSGQASLERQNVVAFVKDYAYSALRENADVQLLVAALPEDERQWRYKSNSKGMQKSNALATAVVEDVFDREPVRSGYDEAMAAVVRYAAENRRRNGLDDEEEATLVANGRERLVERSVNGLYKTLKQLTPADRPVRTVMTDLQSSSDDELTQAVAVTGSDAAAFALRVRGYAGRKQVHERDVSTFKHLADEFDAADARGVVDSSAHVMRLFYEEELRYHMQCADKYRTFLSFDHAKDVAAVERLTPMFESLSERFDPLLGGPARVAYQEDLRAYTFDCYTSGVASFKEWDAVVAYDGETVSTRHVLPVRPKTKAENLTAAYFETIKAKDVHHLGLDYLNRPDTTIAPRHAQTFADAYASRLAMSEQAKQYVAETGQTLALLDRTMDDITDMERVVDQALADGTIEVAHVPDVPLAERRQYYTIRADANLDVAARVERVLRDQEVTLELDR